jgi:general secretion pathway protein N
MCLRSRAASAVLASGDGVIRLSSAQRLSLLKRRDHLPQKERRLKSLRVVLSCVSIVFLCAAVLVWFFPARWALVMFGRQLHGLRIEQAHGLVWQGRAEHVYAPNGMDMGAADWSLSRRALLGDVWLDIHIQQSKLQFTGQMHRISASAVDWRNVTLHVDAAWLGPQAWLNQGEPQGWLDIRRAQLHLQGEWPMQGSVSGQWHDAAVRERYQSVFLGTLVLRIEVQGGIVQATMNDDGRSPLQMAGRLSLSPLGWNATVNLASRRSDPALWQWLRAFGKPSPDGTLYLHYRGGLAQLTPQTEQP